MTCYPLTPDNEDELAGRAREAMRRGALVVYPTDTVYGLGTDARNVAAVKSVYRAKKRPSDKPISISVHSLNQLKRLAFIDERIEGILSKILPGPYTVILNSKEELPHLSPKGKIGIRMPNHRLSLKLSRDFPITSTSANLSGRPSPRSISEVTTPADIIIDGGPTPLGLESTIIDFTQDRPKVIRKGSGNLNSLRDAVRGSGVKSPIILDR